MTIPSTVVTDLVDMVTSIVAGNLPLIILFFGVTIAFYVATGLRDIIKV